jgi:hypothetical protein
LPKRDRGSTALAGQIGFSGDRGCRGSLIAPPSPPRVPRGNGKEAATVLDQDVLDKDINALNETSDVETEN